MDPDGTWHGGRLDPGHIVLDGDPVPLPRKGGQLPNFGLCLLWPNGWMHQSHLFQSAFAA